MDYIIYQLCLGSRCGFNELTGKFEHLSTENATLYTKIEAEKKKNELLAPFIDRYQSTGIGYQEIHFGLNNKQ